MAWVRIDDQWGLHPKVVAAGYAGMGLFVWSLTYCNMQDTGGFVPRGVWPALGGEVAAAKALVKCGLWEVVEGGYRVHDYAEYQWTREQSEAQRLQRTAAGRQGAAARWHRNGMAEVMAE